VSGVTSTRRPPAGAAAAPNRSPRRPCRCRRSCRPLAGAPPAAAPPSVAPPAVAPPPVAAPPVAARPPLPSPYPPRLAPPPQPATASAPSNAHPRRRAARRRASAATPAASSTQGGGRARAGRRAAAAAVPRRRRPSRAGRFGAGGGVAGDGRCARVGGRRLAADVPPPPEWPAPPLGARRGTRRGNAVLTREASAAVAAGAAAAGAGAAAAGAGAAAAGAGAAAGGAARCTARTRSLPSRCPAPRGAARARARHSPPDAAHAARQITLQQGSTAGARRRTPARGRRVIPRRGVHAAAVVPALAQAGTGAQWQSGTQAPASQT
jgi:hypothetical protein